MFKNAREIPFAPGYFVDTDGEIYNSSGRQLTKTNSKSKNRGKSYRVKIKVEGIFKNVDVGTIMKKTFFKGLPPDYVLWHKNGMSSDFQLGNLEAISRSELCLRAGKNNGKKAVAKIDNEGNVIEFYASASEAARKNFFSKATMWLRCEGKIDQAMDSVQYVWAEDIEND